MKDIVVGVGLAVVAYDFTEAGKIYRDDPPEFWRVFNFDQEGAARDFAEFHISADRHLEVVHCSLVAHLNSVVYEALPKPDGPQRGTS